MLLGLRRVLMITDAHTWYDLPDHGRQMLRCPYQLLTQVRDRIREDLAVILAARLLDQVTTSQARSCQLQPLLL